MMRLCGHAPEYGHLEGKWARSYKDIVPALSHLKTSILSDNTRTRLREGVVDQKLSLERFSDILETC